MPWNAASFKKRHNQGLSAEQARVAAEVANETLRRTGDEGRAVRAGNAAAARIGKKKRGRG